MCWILQINNCTKETLLVQDLAVLSHEIVSKGSEAGDNATENLVIRCRKNERRALMEFKSSVFDEFETLSSWGNNDDVYKECCNWKGIRCSNRTGHVIAVNIPGGLSGKVSPKLSELKYLKYLNLSNNYLTGEIYQLGNFTNLRSLDLQHNFDLTVRNLAWLSNLRFLTFLDLSLVDLSSCNGWLNQIYKLSSLTELHLRFSRLPEFDLPVSNTSFSATNALAVIDLSGNNFESSSSYNWLFNFTTNLRYVDLSYTSFSKNRIPESFGRIVSLDSLILSFCELEGRLPDSFRNLSRLATLDMMGNNLSGSISKFLHPLATKEKNSLQALNLDWNKLHGSLPDYLTSFPSLREISLSRNKLNGSFPENFWQLSSSLVHLSLSYNQITGPLPNLTLFSSLERLILSNNKLEDTIPEAYLSNLSKLNYLDLSSNSLSFNFSFDWIPPFKLDILILKNCSLGPRFPNWIRSQRNISVLDISHARISDTIPEWFWHLSPRLRKIMMSYNQMKGTLPNISFTFPEIEWIDLSYNILLGPIPPLPVDLVFLDLAHNMFTGSLSFLCTSSYERIFHVDLSDNRLSGDLPSNCLMNAHLLSTLNLANNDFSGNIPSSMGLSYLLSFQLRNNSFTGKLPLSLMNNTYLQLLDLSKNKLTGKVPAWIGTHLTSLVVLSLYSNELSGRIPPQICHLKDAQVLDLSQNNLTGSIPHCVNNFTSLLEREIYYEFEHGVGYNGDSYSDDRSFKYVNAVVQWKGTESTYERTLRYLKLIDLSSNRLVGDIPKEFASLKGLISLNLSRNNLTGNIIPNIGQMKNLECLDLSRNHLSGEIPSGLASLTLLSVLDVSNNNLSGEIPLSTQLQSFDASKYTGNEQLCGLPLSKKCRHDETDEYNEEQDDKFSKIGLYVSVVLGFGTGFWGFIGPLMFRRTWRQYYHKLLDNITDWIRKIKISHMIVLQRNIYG